MDSFSDMQELHNIDLDIAADGPDIGAIIRIVRWRLCRIRSIRHTGTNQPLGNRGHNRQMFKLTVGASKMTIDGFSG